MAQPTVDEMFDLSGQVALVTGGARNLGLDMATALAEAGADVAITSRTLENAQASARQLTHGRSKSIYKEVTMAQLHTIMSIYNRGEVSMSELSALTNVSPPSASVMVDRLVEKGILLREHSSRDRRKVMVKISPKAVNGIKQIEEGILQSLARLVEAIGPETAHKWCEVIEKDKTVLEKEDS